MTTVPARVAEAWREEAARWEICWVAQMQQNGVRASLASLGDDTPAGLQLLGSREECRAWIDEQCGRAAARVVLDDLMGTATEMRTAAGNHAMSTGTAPAVLHAMLAQARREMGL